MSANTLAGILNDIWDSTTHSLRISGGSGGSAVETQTHSATSKTTPVDADEIPLVDSASSFGLKKLTWANLKATLKTYLDTLYAPTTQRSYALMAGCLATTFANTTTYIGGRFGASSGSVGFGRIYIPKSGTVKRIDVFFASSAIGTAENTSLYFRLNNTTDTAISTTIDLSSQFVTVSNASLNIAVNAGDFFELKHVGVTKVSQATSTNVNATIYIES